MSLTTVALIAIAAWIVVPFLAVALCSAASSADSKDEWLHSALGTQPQRQQRWPASRS